MVDGLVPFERVHDARVGRALAHVEQPHEAVVRARGQPPPARRERHAHDELARRLERGGFVAGVDVLS